MEIVNACIQAGEVSTRFERNNSDLKRRYLIKNIDTINTIMENVVGFCGSFGTGYPFYALDSNLDGKLPIINEQIRYNEELIEAAKKEGPAKWVCARCLRNKGHMMPDLKQICKPCPQISNELKPRKIINRLPDVDMWLICEDSYVEDAKVGLSTLFDKFNMYTSDVDPMRTIQDITEIVASLENDEMPSKKLPLDIHIIEYSKFNGLIDEVPFVLQCAIEDNLQPYLPIHPTSLRKTWQHDDVAYNFILDFMLSMTPFNWESHLMQKFNYTKGVIANAFTQDQLSNVLHSVAPDSVERRLETMQLQKTYERRISSWKK